MKKTFCDVCGKETDWNGYISTCPARHVYMNVHVTTTISSSDAGNRDTTNYPADICKACFLKALNDIEW